MKIRRYWFGYDPNDAVSVERAFISRKKHLKHQFKQDLQYLKWEQQKCLERIEQLKAERERLMKVESTMLDAKYEHVGK